MEFLIRASNGDAMRIDGENWLVAMGRALEFFRDGSYGLGTLTVTPGDDGSVKLDETDPPVGLSTRGRRRSWTVNPARAVKVVAVVAKGEALPEALDAPEPPEKRTPTPVPAISRPPPSIAMPVKSSLAKEAPVPQESLVERLFDLSIDIAGAGVDEACGIAMRLVLDLVPAEAASVARTGDQGLVYAAATGPVSDAILGKTVPFGTGLAGQCHELHATLVVNDVSVDRRHLRAFDEDTGFHTKAVLCAAIVDEEGVGHGVIQVLNPRSGTFPPEAVEIVETIARTLGIRLQGT